MVRQWQEMFYEERYSEVYLSPTCPTTSAGPRPWGAWASGSSRPTTWPRPSTRPTPSTTDRWSSTPHRRLRKVFPMVAAGPPTTIMVEPPHDRRTRYEGLGTDKHHHTLTVLVENKSGVLGPGGGPLLPAGLQHLQPGGRPSDDRAVQPDHHRGRRRVGAAGPDHQAARQADPRRLDPRARSGARPRAELLLATVEAGPSAWPGHPAGRCVRGQDRRCRPGPAHGDAGRRPAKLDDFEDLIRGYGIVELQRTGRVVLPS